MDAVATKTVSTAKQLRIDLRGKTPDEVVAILQENGYRNISHCIEKGWGERSIFNMAPKPEDKEQIVRRIAIADDEAPKLTVVVFNGTEHTLRAGHDLHFFEQYGDRQTGWGWARTSYLYK